MQWKNLETTEMKESPLMSLAHSLQSHLKALEGPNQGIKGKGVLGKGTKDLFKEVVIHPWQGNQLAKEEHKGLWRVAQTIVRD